MLVVTRREGERIDLYERSTGKKVGSISIEKMLSGGVRVGLDFPSNILLLRGELAAPDPAEAQGPAAQAMTKGVTAGQ